MSTYDESHVQAVIEEATARITDAMLVCAWLIVMPSRDREYMTYHEMINEAANRLEEMESSRAAAMADVEPPKEK